MTSQKPHILRILREKLLQYAQCILNTPPLFHHFFTQSPRKSVISGWSVGSCILRILPFMLPIMLFGCTKPTLYQMSNARIAATQKTIDQDTAHYNTSPPPVVMHQGYYINTTPYVINHDPAWMHRRLLLQAQNLPLGILMNRLLLNSGMSVSYDHSVSPQQLVSINYSGDVKGALDRLAAITHLNYSISGYSIDWSAFVDKTFNISFMPGTSNYMVGQSQSQSQQSAQSSTTQTGASSTPLDDSQYSNMQGQLSVWSDLANTLNELKSKDGKVIVSEATTSVTVHDYAYNVDQMSKYINQLNQSLSQEVGIRVQVIEVDLNNSYNFGINWNIVQKVLGTNVSLTGDMSSATNLVATNLVNNSTNTGLAGFQIGNSDGSNVLLNALSQQGKVRVVTKPQVVTMNNQIASIRITEDTGYIESISSSQFDQYETTSITPGTVTDGFTLYVLPKIQGNQVYMQISSRIANLVSLQKVSNEPNGTQNSNSSTNNQYSAIEVPTIDSKEFNQRSVVQSGSTLIIAGYKKLADETQNAKMFGISALGGQGATQNNVETLVLISPIILQSTSQ